MKVQITAKKGVFIYGRMVKKGESVTLNPVTCVKKTDSKGNALIITPEQQFSTNSMRKIEEPKKPGRPKKDES